MRLFGLNITRNSKESPISGYSLTEDDRETSKEIRALKAEQRKLSAEMALERQKLALEKQRWEIQQIKSELYGDDEDEETDDNPLESAMLPLLMGALRPQQPQTEGVQQQTVQQVNYTDEEIKQFIAQIPKKQLSAARIMQESTLRKLILGYQPNVSEDTLQRAVKLLRA